jgi:hypothetical protein
VHPIDVPTAVERRDAIVSGPRPLVTSTSRQENGAAGTREPGWSS